VAGVDPSLRRSRTSNHDLNFAAVAVVRVVEEDVDVADHANGPSHLLILIAGPYGNLAAGAAAD